MKKALRVTKSIVLGILGVFGFILAFLIAVGVLIGLPIWGITSLVQALNGEEVMAWAIMVLFLLVVVGLIVTGIVKLSKLIYKHGFREGFWIWVN